VRAAFQRRSIEALDRIASTATIENLSKALAAPIDVGTLAEHSAITTASVRRWCLWSRSRR